MDLAFTFGIITDGSADAVKRLDVILDSIEAEKIAAYEVIIVGNCPRSLLRRGHTRIVPFDESQKARWITRKKNLITASAAFENVVYMHDYVALEPGWYAGWQIFGNDFAACMNPIRNTDGSRYRDWSLFYDASSQPARDYAGIHQLENLLPYTERSLSRTMYFSGAYWVAKRRIMRELPLDERLCWAEGEDVIWSHRFRRGHDFSLNAHSRVRLFGKRKDPIFREIPGHKLDLMKSFLAVHAPEPGYGCSDDMVFWGMHGHFGPGQVSRPAAALPTFPLNPAEQLARQA
jgi:hypothetical protein